MIFFAYICYEVSKIYAWSLALLMLISSGFMQIAIHSCPGSGIFVFRDCGMHASAEIQDMPACCKKKFTVESDKKDCGNCEDYFVFSITPKFGTIHAAETGDPPVFILEKSPLLSEGKSGIVIKEDVAFATKPPPKIRHICALHCSWLI